MAAVTSNKTERPKGSVVALTNLSRVAATYNSSSLKFPNAKRAHIVVNVVAVGGAGTLDIIVQGFDPVSKGWYNILVMTQITAISIPAGKIAAGIPASAGVAVDDVLPEEFRINAVVGTNAVEFSVGINLIDE